MDDNAMTGTPIIDQDGAHAQPLIEHLIELRRRLIIAFGFFLVASIACYTFAEPIYAFLVQPLADNARDGQRLIYTGLAEAFLTYLKVAFFAGGLIALPVIMLQIWLFIAPGLFANERRAFLPYLLATPILFIMGAALAYYGIIPLAWNFFLSFENPGVGVDQLPIVLEARVGEYLSLTMTLIMAFGLAFQLPILLALLVRTGLISAADLSAKRKYAYLGVLIMAAFLTPPDIVSQLGLAIPMAVLYESSVILARIIERNRRERKAKTNA